MRKKSTGTFVYVLKGGRGCYKIGFSTDPYSRINDFRIANPTVRVVLILVADRKTETDLHKHFSKKRLSKEWFRLSDSDLIEVENIAYQSLDNDSRNHLSVMSKELCFFVNYGKVKHGDIIRSLADSKRPNKPFEPIDWASKEGEPVGEVLTERDLDRLYSYNPALKNTAIALSVKNKRAIGWPIRDIAASLSVSIQTVRHYSSALYKANK